MKRWSNRHQLRLITEISVTPLLDLVLVLLFVFMLAAPLMRNDTLTLPASRSADAETQPDDIASLTVDTQRFITLEAEPVLDGALPAALSNLRAKRPGVAVRVEMHRDLPVQLLVDIMDDLREAGIEKTSVVTSRVIGR